MAAKSPPMTLDMASRFEGAVQQFQGLNASDPGQWPLLPRLLAWLAVALAVLALGWFFLLSGAHDELEAARGQEPSLKQDYRAKLTQAVNLGELRKQKLQVQEFVTQLEKQLSVFATTAATPDRAPAMAGPCGSCGHPDGPGGCRFQ